MMIDHDLEVRWHSMGALYVYHGSLGEWWILLDRCGALIEACLMPEETIYGQKIPSVRARNNHAVLEASVNDLLGRE